jgi:hypothetical protein
MPRVIVGNYRIKTRTYCSPIRTAEATPQPSIITGCGPAGARPYVPVAGTRMQHTHLSTLPAMPFDEKRPLSASTLKLRAGRLARSKPLWALVLVSYLFVLYLRRLDSYVAPQTDGAARKLPAPYTSGPAVGPPTWDRLRKWERELPQHNQSLPFPEGRHGRYVRFTNQVHTHAPHFPAESYRLPGADPWARVE